MNWREPPRRVRRWLRPVPLLGVSLAAIWLISPNSFLADIVGSACVTGVWVVSWMVFCGPTRELSFGHALFIGAAGYGAALVQVRLGWNPWLSLAFGALLGAGLGLLLALSTFRHRGLYFSMITMALQASFHRTLYLGSSLLGGDEGVIGIRPLASQRQTLFAIEATSLFLACLVVDRFLRSRTGLLLGALGQSEPLALSLGANAGRLRMKGLALSGLLAGLGGSLYVLTQGQANAELASSQTSIRCLLLGIAGGLWSLPGALAATFGLQGVQSAFFGQTRYDALIYLVILMVLVLFLPHGLVPHRPRWGEPAHDSPTRAAGFTPSGGLSLREVTLRFGGLVALQGLNLEMAPGSALGIIGPNGAGKTTLLNVIAGQRACDAGEVRWNGRLLRGGDSSAHARLGVRKTHQEVISFPDFSLREHLAVARASTRASAESPELRALLEACGPLGALDRPLRELPPSVARMAEVAMALASPPELLLVDEPFAALSGAEVDAVGAALKALRGRGVSMIIVEHRLHELFQIVEEVVVMNHGTILVRLPPAQVLSHPAVLNAYGIGENAAGS